MISLGDLLAVLGAVLLMIPNRAGCIPRHPGLTLLTTCVSFVLATRLAKPRMFL
ncbi:MAG TPA: hypothetical protein VLA64_01150 [Azonexus sp.]|nr:hypothetical protein [Azonexus sp.]